MTVEAGREGILRGFKEAEKIWGGKLSEISYQTIEKALADIDERVPKLGDSVIDRGLEKTRQAARLKAEAICRPI